MRPVAGSTATRSKLVSDVARLSRRDRLDERELARARRDLTAVQIEDYVTGKLAASPPLTSRQRTRLRALFDDDWASS